MKCSECKFADKDSSENYATCIIKLPAWIQKRENNNGRLIYVGEFGCDECDLGVKETENG